MPKTGFQSRSSRIGMGIGILSVSRGYGPITNEPIVAPPPFVSRQGGSGPVDVIPQPLEKPKVTLVRPEAKKVVG